MARRSEEYRVDYHVILASYFSSGCPVPGPLLGKIWARLRAVGGLHTEIAIAERTETAQWHESGALGSPAIERRLIRTSGEIDLFGASAVRPDAHNAILDSDVNCSYRPHDVWDGQATVGMLKLSLSEQVIERAGEKVVLDVLKSVFEIADKCRSHYGLVDIAKPDDAYAGMVFGCTWPSTAPLHRWIEQHNWATSGALKGDRARGIYWGNYFGPAILKRLGGRERFLKRFRQNARYYDGTPDALIWEFPNGVFISLCDTIADMKPGECLPPSADENFRWLCNELGPKGVLNPW